ncbi:MAG: rod shape-determining protein RodA [Clostridiales bacterium]|nr:rod shape-determining protein RodA [Clostridiales bacterium]
MYSRNKHSFDITLVVLVAALVIFGIIAISSATRTNIYGFQGEAVSQIIWFATGLILMFLVSFIDYHFICGLWIPIYIINIILLIAVLLFGSGDGVSRWIFGIQPSEFAKIFIIICLAKFIDKSAEKIDNISVLLYVAVMSAVPAVLIKIQPSLSASLVIIAIALIMLFCGGLNRTYIFVCLGIIIPVAVILFIDIKSDEHMILGKFLDSYQLNRLVAFFSGDITSADPTLYQTKNSIWAIGSGGLKGKGLYNGTINQLSYLPESHNDFIFSVIGEEFGFLGCIGVLILLFLIISKCIFKGMNAADNLGRLLACGVAGMIAFQAFVNVGVTTGVLPNTGMPLPFVSYGGSSLWANMIGIGLVLNVGMNKQKSMFEG